MFDSISQCWHAGSCDSTITYIDGKKGVLLYRGRATASTPPFWRTTTFIFKLPHAILRLLSITTIVQSAELKLSYIHVAFPCSYDIEDLAEQGDFLDSAYLLLMGELPTPEQKTAFDRELTMHTLVHEQLIQFFKGFKHDAHPMAIMVGVVGALSAFEPYSADLA